MVLLPLLLVLIPAMEAAIGSENTVLEPVVDCGEEAMSLTIRTIAPFRGTLFIRGRHDDESCSQTYLSNDQNKATLSIRIGDCGMKRFREIQPAGMRYELVFVAIFQPHFETKMDRAFSVKCTYTVADKVLQANIGVSSLPAESISESSVILPNCRYSILSGSLDGPRARETAVGRPLVHLWQCDNPNYGMLVRNCVVTDGAGASIQWIDERGCPAQLEIMTRPLIYDTSLNMAHTTMEAFNFPDRTSLQFQCQMSVCSKQDNECPGFTPPNCPHVPRNAFVGNSIVDASVNPTQVVATFQGAVRSNHVGETLIDGTIIPAGVQEQRGPMAMPIPSMIPSSSSEFLGQPWLREQNPIDERESGEEEETQTATDSPNAIQNQTEAPPISSSRDDWSIPPSRLYLREPPLEIFTRNTPHTRNTPAGTTNAQTTERPSSEGRHRRLADQVMDVASEMIYVRPVDELTDAQPQSFPEKSPSAPSSSSSSTMSSDLTCLNQSAVMAMSSAFALTTLLSLVFITCLWRDLYKTCGSRDESCCGDVSDRASTVFSSAGAAPEVSLGDPPIYTRRLGHPAYVLPFRHYN